jgi:hypothetical protein
MAAHHVGQDRRRRAQAGECRAAEGCERRAARRLAQGAEPAGRCGGYVNGLKLKDGVVPGEADKPLLEAVGTLALERGMPQETVNDFVGLFYDMQQSLHQQRTELDGEHHRESQSALAQELGADFKPTMNVLKTLWTEHGTPEVQETILTARTADGRVIGDMPEVVKFLAKLGRELNPAAAILPQGGGHDIKAVTTRKAEIEGMMYLNGKQNPAYWNDAKVQEEYRGLIDAEQKMTTRAA